MSLEQLKPLINNVSDSISKFIKNKLAEYQDQNLNELINIIEYSVLGSGKMIRPLLTCIIGEAVHADQKDIIKIASAIELIHCYSLIHDDLPAMDNDNLRRGKASTHIAFGEANAILAGDTIQSLAFEILSEIDHPNNVKIINIFAKSIGIDGLVGGQFLDLKYENNSDIDLALVNQIIQQKTGSLIKLACILPIYLNDRYQDILSEITEFGNNIGIAFQIADDLLDAKGDSEKLGKETVKDLTKGKPNILAVMPYEKAELIAQQLIENAKSNISILQEQAEPLIILADYILSREK